MKRFAIIEVAAGIFIADTQKTKHPAQAITASADSYEAAVKIRDHKRLERETQQITAAEKWHQQYDKAYASGNFDQLNQLCGIK